MVTVQKSVIRQPSKAHLAYLITHEMEKYLVRSHVYVSTWRCKA